MFHILFFIIFMIINIELFNNLITFPLQIYKADSSDCQISPKNRANSGDFLDKY